MKNKWTPLCVVLAMLFSVLSKADTAVLLMGKVQRAEGNSRAITGANKAVIKVGSDQTTVIANEIVFDTAGKILLCSGASTVSSADRTIKGNDLRIELGGGSVSVFLLNPEGMPSVGARSGFESWKPTSNLSQFGDQLPSVDLKLERSNKSSTPTAVTPRAMK